MSTPAGLSTQADVTGDLNLECGVVIVGSGAGGATVAAELAEAGVDVLVLEEGVAPDSILRIGVVVLGLALFAGLLWRGA